MIVIQGKLQKFSLLRIWGGQSVRTKRHSERVNIDQMANENTLSRFSK